MILNDGCLTPSEQCCAQLYYGGNKLQVRFVLDQHTWLNFYSNSPFKQQFVDRHVAPLGHIILIPRQ